jgi:hypothetical protein
MRGGQFPGAPLLSRALASAVLASLAGCGGGGDDGGGSQPPPAGSITVTGTVTYQKVPSRAAGVGLDYNAIVNSPVRGAVVEAIDGNNRTTILTSTNTDANGAYSLQLQSGRTAFIRVKAQLLRTGTPSWNFRVVDNTNAGALYVLDGTNFTTSTAPLIIDLNAGSGWNGMSYTAGQRTAAPFSLLDVAYEMLNLVLSANANAAFTALDINWSPQNKPSADFVPAMGDIVTTSFVPGSPSNMYVLGLENVDTDEFDQHVIAHELGHYFQDVFSRDDSLGGAHGGGERLDLRVAFSEGWGNAFSGMVMGSARYSDSLGMGQSGGFTIDLESNVVSNPGWFSEGSVTSLLYDFFDADADGADAVSLGFAPIFQVMNSDLPPLEPHTAIFPFVRALKERNGGSAAAIDALVSAQNIVSATIDDLGSTEVNNGGAAANLPVYVPIMVNIAPVQVCSSTANGDYNKLGNRKFVRFNVPFNQNLQMRAVGPVGTDPDMALYRQGFVAESVEESTGDGREIFNQSLTAGNYVLEVFDFFATDDPGEGTPGNTCINVSIITTP